MSDRYTPLKVIGEGSYGKVVKASCKATGREVAIKFIEHVNLNEYDCVKAIREIQLLKRLSKMSTFIVEIIDAFSYTDDGRLNLFIVMEYFGHDLKNVLTHSS